MVRQERRQDEILIKMFILISGGFHLVPRRNFSMNPNTTPHDRDEIKWGYSVTACTKSPQLHERCKWKGGGVSPHPEIIKMATFWNWIWDKSPNMNCWFLFAQNLNPLSQVGYSCPGTSLDWIYDKLQSSDAGKTCMTLQVSSWLRKEPTNTTKNHKPNIIANNAVNK